MELSQSKMILATAHEDLRSYHEDLDKMLITVGMTTDPSMEDLIAVPDGVPETIAHYAVTLASLLADWRGLIKQTHKDFRSMMSRDGFDPNRDMGPGFNNPFSA